MHELRQEVEQQRIHDALNAVTGGAPAIGGFDGQQEAHGVALGAFVFRLHDAALVDPGFRLEKLKNQACRLIGGNGDRVHGKPPVRIDKGRTCHFATGMASHPYAEGQS